MNILYGLNGEGMGHALRSKVVIEELQKEHKVKVITADRAYSFLRKFFIDYAKVLAL